MDAPWTIQQLADAAAETLSRRADYRPANGRIRDVPNLRTIRYYTTIGLLDRPALMKGRTAFYGRRHLLQLLAVKRLQSQDRSLVEIQAALLNRTDADLERLAAIGAEPAAADARQCQATEVNPGGTLVDKPPVAPYQSPSAQKGATGGSSTSARQPSQECLAPGDTPSAAPCPTLVDKPPVAQSQTPLLSADLPLARRPRSPFWSARPAESEPRAEEDPRPIVSSVVLCPSDQVRVIFDGVDRAQVEAAWSQLGPLLRELAEVHAQLAAAAAADLIAADRVPSPQSPSPHPEGENV